MDSPVYGTRFDPARQHAVLDVVHWTDQHPLGEKRPRHSPISAPWQLAEREQAVSLARSLSELGQSSEADVFVWSDWTLDDKPWLTQLGGSPWRAADRPWPQSIAGLPLTFLGQICFVDSRDIVPKDLPGDVALVFGIYTPGWISAEEAVIEWSSLTLKNPMSQFDVPPGGLLPFAYRGIIHRTRQFHQDPSTDAAFKTAGFKDGDFHVAAVQATSIGGYASLPQGWPFQPGDHCTLVASLSSFYFERNWPLCDVPRGPSSLNKRGEEIRMSNTNALELPIGDGGCIWVFRDADGCYMLDSAHE